MVDKLDKKDMKILVELQLDSDRKIHQYEKRISLPRSTIHNRIKRMKKEGVIKQIKAVVDPEKLGLDVCALIHIVVSYRKGVYVIARKLSRMVNVEEVNITAGAFDIIAKVRFKNNKELSDFIFNEKTGIKVWQGVVRTESMICVDTVKENGVLEQV